jgi:hypothetical protein
MNRILILISFAAANAWSQSLDFSSLDKLATKAKNVARVSLDSAQLKAALSLLSSADKNSGKEVDQVKALAEKLTSVEVRNFEFAQKGSYTEADVAPVRQQMARLMGDHKGCSKVIDTKEESEHTEIYMCIQDGKTSGLGIISAEQEELSIVLLKGSPSLQDLKGLGGVMALPSMGIGPAERKSPKVNAQ